MMYKKKKKNPSHKMGEKRKERNLRHSGLTMALYLKKKKNQYKVILFHPKTEQINGLMLF